MTGHSLKPAAGLTPSERIIHAVAEQVNTDPRSLPPLYHTIDPDAIDRILTNVERCKLQFEYVGQQVSIHSDGAIQMTAADDSKSPKTH